MNIERIKKNVSIGDGDCWIWKKSKNSAGYGQLSESKNYWMAHRYAYSCVNGKILDGLVIRHKCHNKACCNPEHLDIGTHRDNYHDSLASHQDADKKMGKNWSIDGVTYQSCRDASKSTGISTSSLVKFTKQGVFDVELYRKSCFIAGCKPRV